MTIQQLKYVLAVADLKNFEAAADKCFVTQSTLSTMIKRLENEIEVSIFNRKTKPVSITPEGNQIIEKMRVVVREMDSLNNHIQEIKGEYVGDLKIGVIPTIAPYLMPLFMNDFALSHPRINLSPSSHKRASG